VYVNESPRAISLVSPTTICSGNQIQLKAGKVLSFDGVNDQVLVPGFSTPANGGAVTVEFWIKVLAADLRNSSTFSVGTDQYNRLQAHAPYGNGMLYFDYGNINNPASRIAVDYNPYLGKWTHVALVSSGKANTFKGIYINGKLVASANTSDGNATLLSGLKIGSFVNNTLFLKGQIDEFKIWSVVRTEAQIKDGLNKVVAANTAGLMLYLQMHEGTGTVVFDKSGKGLNGTLTNGPTWIAPYTNVTTYSWTPATSPQSGELVYANPTTSTNYWLTVTDNKTGCTDLNYTPVTVTPAPCALSLLEEQTDLDGSAIITDIEFANQRIKIYPNPTNGNFKITMNEAKPVTIEIINAKGIKVKEIKGEEKEILINAMELLEGLYVENVISDKRIYRKKITIIK